MPPEPSAPHTAPGGEAARSSWRVLYVDDDRINTYLFEQACESIPGCMACCAGSAAEALSLAAEQSPDLLVLDLHLPDAEGWQLLASLRGISGLADVPAVLCTAEPRHLVHDRALATGFLEVWEKPVTGEVLGRALAIICGPDRR